MSKKIGVWLSTASGLMLVVALACGGSDVPPTPVPGPGSPAVAPLPPASQPPTASAATSPPPEPTAAPPADIEVASDIKGFALEDLTIEIGTRVTWTNRDGVGHTTTSGSRGTRTGLWDSTSLASGDAFSFTFTEEGKFQYFCRIHPDSMNSVVTVVAGGQPGAVATQEPAEAVAKGDAAATDAPPTPTPVPPTATSVPPAETAIPPTATVAPSTPSPTPTETPPAAVSATATAAPPPTSTSVPATATPPPTATALPPTATPPPAIIRTAIIDFELNNVSVAVGTTIVWENQGDAPHTTTSGVSHDTSPLWDSGTLNPGQTFRITFDQIGEFQYFCTIHPFMTATITVSEAGGPGSEDGAPTTEADPYDYSDN